MTDELDNFVTGMLVEDEEARYEAARALARLGRPAIDVALALVESPDIRCREIACYVLGGVSNTEKEPYVKLTDGVPTLLRVLETDSDAIVRASAACALGQLSAEEATPVLCSLVTAASSELRFSVAYALGSFYESCWERVPDYKAMAQTALLALTHDPDEEVRDWAVFGLHQGGHDTHEVRARFWEALNDSNPDVRGEAASGLAKFGDRSIIPRLIDLLEHDTLSPLYFEAAVALDDAVLLPAVLLAEQRWRDDLEEGEEMNQYVTSAVSALKSVASVNQVP